MNRRRFLLGLAGGSAALVGRASPQNAPVMARIGVDYEAAGRAIACVVAGVFRARVDVRVATGGENLGARICHGGQPRQDLGAVRQTSQQPEVAAEHQKRVEAAVRWPQ